MVSSRAWFALAVGGVLGLFYVGAGLQSSSPGLVYGQVVPVQPLFAKPTVKRPSLVFSNIVTNASAEISRAKIPGGWLVFSRAEAVSSSSVDRPFSTAVAFVPDPENKWDGNSLP